METPGENERRPIEAPQWEGSGRGHQRGPWLAKEAMEQAGLAGPGGSGKERSWEGLRCLAWASGRWRTSPRQGAWRRADFRGRQEEVRPGGPGSGHGGVQEADTQQSLSWRQVSHHC